jgi:hypothetical protein
MKCDNLSSQDHPNACHAKYCHANVNAFSRSLCPSCAQQSEQISVHGSMRNIRFQVLRSLRTFFFRFALSYPTFRCDVLDPGRCLHLHRSRLWTNEANGHSTRSTLRSPPRCGTQTRICIIHYDINIDLSPAPILPGHIDIHHLPGRPSWSLVVQLHTSTSGLVRETDYF